MTVHADRVRRETAANTLAAVVIAALLSWLIFRGATEIDPFAAAPGGIFGILPGTFNFTLLVTIALTLVVRRRVQRGAWTRMTGEPGGRLENRLPANLLLRALVLAFAVTLLLVPAAAALVYAATRIGLVPASWSLAGITAFFVAYFVVLSLIVTPVIVRRALRD